MSVHDETWDKCPYCKGVIKTWHGDSFHETAACTQFEKYMDWHEALINSKFQIDLSSLPNAHKTPF